MWSYFEGYKKDITGCNVGPFFQEKVAKSAIKIRNSFPNTIMRSWTPYTNLNANITAIWHPLYYAAQTVRDVARFLYGAFVLVGALLSGNFHGAYATYECMTGLIIITILNLLNTLLSAFFLLTRSLVSYKDGYLEEQYPTNTDSLRQAVQLEQEENQGIFTLI